MASDDGGRHTDAIRVLPGESANSQPAAGRHNRGAWLVLVAATILAIGVFAVGEPVHRSAGPDDHLDTADSVEVDLTASGLDGFLDKWTSGRVDGGATVLAVTNVGGRVVAVGASRGRAAAWRTVFGDRWEPVSILEPSGATSSVITRTVKWRGETLGFGRVDSTPALWRADSADRWAYVGPIPAFDATFLIDVVAGDDGLLAVTGTPGGAMSIFNSTDGANWTGLDREGLEEIEQMQAVTAYGGWFYAAGMNCSDDACRPAIHRSVSGNDWEAVRLPAIGAGRLSDIAATRDGIVAVGSVDVGGGTSAALLLQSGDGTAWVRDDTARAFMAPQVSVELLSTSSTGVAALLIQGAEYELGVEASVLTEAASFSVVGIDTNQVTLGPSDPVRLAIGRPVSFAGGVALQQVSAQGDRIVVTGTFLSGDESPQPTIAGVWSSNDGGGHWARSTADTTIRGSVSPYTPSTRIVLIGGDGEETLTWTGEWSTGARNELDYAADRVTNP